MSTIKEHTELLVKAAKAGNADEVRRILPLIDQKVDHSALRLAAQFGHVECVELLIPVSNPKHFDSVALRLATQNGHTQCVELLIPVSDPKADDSQALHLAALNRHTQCVELLIPVSEPKAKKSMALQLATRNGHIQCVERLYPVSDPEVALQQLQKDYPGDHSKWGQLQQMVEAEQLNTVLHTEIGEALAPRVQRKM